MGNKNTNFKDYIKKKGIQSSRFDDEKIVMNNYTPPVRSSPYAPRPPYSPPPPVYSPPPGISKVPPHPLHTLARFPSVGSPIVNLKERPLPPTPPPKLSSSSSPQLRPKNPEPPTPPPKLSNSSSPQLRPKNPEPLETQMEKEFTIIAKELMDEYNSKEKEKKRQIETRMKTYLKLVNEKTEEHDTTKQSITTKANEEMEILHAKFKADITSLRNAVKSDVREILKENTLK